MADSRPPNAFVRWMRKIYHPLGFQKGYNFTLWFIFGGAIFGFILARMPYLSIGGRFREGSSPGEWYYLRGGHERIGITLHLVTVIPLGFLLVFQFVPWIRHHALMFHRVNGYVIVLLLLISNVGALMIARHSFGGEFETQVYVGLLAILTTVSVILAYINIKRLQIDQHRAWMLRTWFYAGTIITLRIIMIISALIIPKAGGFYQAMPCEKISFIFEDDQAGFQEFFPACFAPNGTNNGWVAVEASFDGSGATVAASLGLCFGTAGWLALAMHAIGVEIYLRLTPREGNRLRNVSYQRQMEAGFRHPGSAGLTSDRWGDADVWQPANPTTENTKGEKRTTPEETAG
ncbi:MAG: hypothetical protein L6R36_006311 [Xanthoria steineri]|nr:MAG: hypothetical protein L6R36_006311 [Xanthoria steineri]